MRLVPLNIERNHRLPILACASTTESDELVRSRFLLDGADRRTTKAMVKALAILEQLPWEQASRCRLKKLHSIRDTWQLRVKDHRVLVTALAREGGISCILTAAFEKRQAKTPDRPLQEHRAWLQRLQRL